MASGEGFRAGFGQWSSRAAAAAASFSACFSLYRLRLIAADCFWAFLMACFAFWSSLRVCKGTTPHYEQRMKVTYTPVSTVRTAHVTLAGLSHVGRQTLATT